MEEVRADRSFDNWCYRGCIDDAVVTGRVSELLQFLDSLEVEWSPECLEHIDRALGIAEGDFNRADSLTATGIMPNSAVWVARLNATGGRIRPSHLALPRQTDRAESLGALILEIVYRIPEPNESVQLTGREAHVVHEFINHEVRAALLGDTSEAKRVSNRLRVMRDSVTGEKFERAFGSMFALMEAGPALRSGDWRSAVE